MPKRSCERWSWKKSSEEWSNAAKYPEASKSSKEVLLRISSVTLISSSNCPGKLILCSNKKLMITNLIFDIPIVKLVNSTYSIIISIQAPALGIGIEQSWDPQLIVGNYTHYHVSSKVDAFMNGYAHHLKASVELQAMSLWPKTSVPCFPQNYWNNHECSSSAEYHLPLLPFNSWISTALCGRKMNRMKNHNWSGLME